MAGIGHRGFMGRKSGGFTPLDDFDFWFDFTDLSSLTLSGSDILIATDKTGNGYDAESVLGARPTWGASKINGLGAALFNGAGQYLKFDSYASQQSSSAARQSLFIVYKTNAPAASQTIVAFSNTGVNNPVRMPLFSHSTSTYRSLYRNNAGGAANPSSSAATDSNYHIYQLNTLDVGGVISIRMKLDGATLLGFASINIGGVTTLNAATIGAWRRTTVFQPFDGEIAEVFFASSDVSGATNDAANAYLSNKYGIPLTS